MSLPSPVNPFEESVDRRGYVPRAACQNVLGHLERQIRAGVPAILLRGPTGIGKSMLLAVLHQRMAEGWQVAHVAVSPSPSMEISHRILDQLEVNADDDPSSALVAAARRSAASGRRVLVIIDQANHVPVASSRQLVRAAARATGDLCILFAVTEEDGAEAFEREIGEEAEVTTVRFDSPMNAQETCEYIAGRLDQTLDSQELRDRFDDAAIRYVIDGAEGNPRRVNELAYETLCRLERGESLPGQYRDAGASAEFDAGRSASPSEESRLQPQTPTYGGAPRSDHSLGGGLLGAGPARDPRELDANRELFPPGFLRSDREPLAPSDEPGPGPGPGSAGAASTRGDAGRGADDRRLERTLEPGESILPVAATEGTAAAASSKRPKLWVAALVVTAVAGGYLAGRVDLASTESSTLPTAAPEPVAVDLEPLLLDLLPTLVRPDRTDLHMPDWSAASASSTPATEPDTTPAASIDSGSALGDAKPAAATLSHVEAASAEQDEPDTVDAVEQADRPPLVAVQAVAPGVSPDLAGPIPATPNSASPAEPRAESIRVASDSGAPSQPLPARGPAPGSAVDDGHSIADGSATAIVVEGRSTAEPGARASAYVRVQVQLEPGAILSIDGERVGVAPISDLIMEPGLHTFVAELPDGLQIEQLIQVSPDTGTVEF